MLHCCHNQKDRSDGVNSVFLGRWAGESPLFLNKGFPPKKKTEEK